MKVRNFISENNTRVRNQFEIFDESGTHFQSYASLIATVDNNGSLHLSPHWDFSRTTSKYLYQFIRRYTHLNVHGQKDIFALIERKKAVVDLNYYDTKVA